MNSGCCKFPGSGAGLVPAGAARRGAFSFVEVLFAVMILGIGFIMLAGIFPVAISQTQATGEENNAANIARSAAAYLERLPGTARLMTPDNRVRRLWSNPYPALPPDFWPFDGDANENNTPDEIDLWHAVKGNLIVAEDPRYAWVAVYRRWQRPRRPSVPAVPQSEASLAHDFAEVTIFVLRVRNRSEYLPSPLAAFPAQPVDGDLFVNTATGQGTLVPQMVRVHLREGYGDGDQLMVDPSFPVHPVRPGAFVVIATAPDATFSPALDVEDRPAAGRIYRIGNAVGDSDSTFFLAPGNDMLVLPGKNGTYNDGDDLKQDSKTAGLLAWVIGEGRVAGPAGTYDYAGGAQEVAVYTTYIKLNP